MSLTVTEYIVSADAGNEDTGNLPLGITGVNMTPNPHFVAWVGDLKALLSPIVKAYVGRRACLKFSRRQ